MQDDCPHLVPRGQVHRGNGADALAVQDDVFGADAQPGPEGVPGGLDVGVQVLFARLPRRGAVTAVVVTENVAVDPAPQAEVEAAHLAQVDGVAVRMEDGEPGVRAALDEHARDSVSTVGPSVKHFQVLLLPVRVLPLGLLCEH